MSTKQPVDAAGEVASRLVEARGGAEPSLPWLTEVVREFSVVEFDVPEIADSDGYLFQYGPVGWFPDPTFAVSIVRQLERVDAAGEHEAYIQVQFELRYSPDEDLGSLGGHAQWWFPGDRVSFEVWLDDVSRTDAWQVLATRIPREAALVEDVV